MLLVWKQSFLQAECGMGPKREFEFTSHVVIRPGEAARAQSSLR